MNQKSKNHLGETDLGLDRNPPCQDAQVQPEPGVAAEPTNFYGVEWSPADGRLPSNLLPYLILKKLKNLPVLSFYTVDNK